MKPPREKPVVTVVHSLPGRVRVRFSQPPEDPDRLAASVGEHPGMGTLAYTPATRSLLVRFDPHAITQEEITLRIAFQLALEQGGQSVRLLAAPEHTVIQDSAVFAAIGLATSLSMRWLKPTRQARRRWIGPPVWERPGRLWTTPGRSFDSGVILIRKC